MLGDSYTERWESGDDGLTCCWLRGLEKAREMPGLASQALAGELPILPWKGGVAGKIKSNDKLGSLQYLAMWQGLRGEDLDIDRREEVSLTCSRHGVSVKFTAIDSRLAQVEE
jgi:hypothetical protein